MVERQNPKPQRYEELLEYYTNMFSANNYPLDHIWDFREMAKGGSQQGIREEHYEDWDDHHFAELLEKLGFSVELPSNFDHMVEYFQGKGNIDDSTRQQLKMMSRGENPKGAIPSPDFSGIRETYFKGWKNGDFMELLGLI